MESKRTLTNRLTTKYLLIVRNEDNFAEKTTYSFTYSKIIFGLLVLFLCLSAFSFYIATSVLEELFDPRYVELKAKKDVLDLTAAVDSLEHEVVKKDRYVQSIKNILHGEVEYANLSSLKGNIGSSQIEEIVQSQKLNPVDSQFRKKFESNGFEVNLSASNPIDDAKDFYLFKPVDGIVTDGYSAKTNHLAVDIVAKQNEPIKCVADGTVILSSWTQDSGNVIAVQHAGNLLSIYKHNSELLKNVGNFVTAGEVISIIGNTGELTSGPHLHFELWYNGMPIDPEEFIRF